MAPTPDQRGYWLVASDGGVFSFGDAGSTARPGAWSSTNRWSSMTATPDGRGYWLVAADGGIFAFGDTRFHGSAAGSTGEPVERLLRTASGEGYWIVEQNGTELPYGDAAGASPPVRSRSSSTRSPPATGRCSSPSSSWASPTSGEGTGRSATTARASRSRRGPTVPASPSPGWPTTSTTPPAAPVAMNDLQAGDLVFWGTDLSDWTSVYHTALYVGGNRIVEATGDQVQLNLLGQWGTGNLMGNGRRP